MSIQDSDGLIKIISVPTEAGTHFPGQCKAPEALINKGGLVDELRSVGYDVILYNGLLVDDKFTAAAWWNPSPKIDGVRNESKTLTVMDRIKKQLSLAMNSHAFPIILGGDCSITPAVLSSLSNVIPANQTYGLLYIDGDVDLTLPAKQTWMVLQRSWIPCVQRTLLEDREA